MRVSLSTESMYESLVPGAKNHKRQKNGVDCLIVVYVLDVKICWMRCDQLCRGKPRLWGHQLTLLMPLASFVPLLMTVGRNWYRAYPLILRLDCRMVTTR